MHLVICIYLLPSQLCSWVCTFELAQGELQYLKKLGQIEKGKLPDGNGKKTSPPSIGDSSNFLLFIKLHQFMLVQSESFVETFQKFYIRDLSRPASCFPHFEKSTRIPRSLSCILKLGRPHPCSTLFSYF
jgi:hypothetical protein